jgi:hypothetical protein
MQAIAAKRQIARKKENMAPTPINHNRQVSKPARR